MLDTENLRLHYSLDTGALDGPLRTSTAEEVRAAMLDEEFVKTWRLYLAGSIAAFNVGELQLFQVVFSREQE